MKKLLCITFISWFFQGCHTYYPSAALGVEEEILAQECDDVENLENLTPELYLAEDSESISSEFFQWPVFGKILSPFGQRGKKFHKGIDIKGNKGEPIKASSEGTVIFAGWKARYGKAVIIQHQDMETLYAHCDQLKVKTGQTVTAGQQIGTVGSSGNARGAHLHFEIRDKQRWINPLDKLPSMVASFP